MITKQDKKNIAWKVNKDYEILEWDLYLANEKLKGLENHPDSENNQNVIIPIYASAVMKAYSNYFGLRQGDVKIQNEK